MLVQTRFGPLLLLRGLPTDQALQTAHSNSPISKKEPSPTPLVRSQYVTTRCIARRRGGGGGEGQEGGEAATWPRQQRQQQQQRQHLSPREQVPR